MANIDKNIVITPNIGSTTADPQIVFSGADAVLGPQNIVVKVYPTSSGTLSFEGSAGQLFSITNSLSGTIFSVNDVSGIPSIEVLDTGLIKLAQYSGNVLLGSGTDNGVNKLQVNGSISATSFVGNATNVSGVVAIVNGGTGATSAAAALTNLGAYAASNPSGYTTNTGTVTSVGGTGTVSGLTLSGTVTTSGNLTLGGTLSLTSANVTTALGFTPYNATNPSGFITTAGARSALSFTAGSGAYNSTTGVITIPTNTNQLTNGAGFTTNTGTVTGVTGTAPIISSGGTAPAISISAATTAAAGSMSSADKTKLDGIAAGAQVNAVTSVAGKTGVVTLVKADVGLSNVDNTSDAAKPVSTAQQTALNLKANIASPVFTGNVTGLGVSTGTSFNAITGLATVAPLVAGTAAVGTSTLTARQDHVHPLQTTVSGNAGSATVLQTARTINGVSFNGSANITVADDTKLPLTGGTLTGRMISRQSGVTLSTGNSSQLEIGNATSGACNISFHREGAYGAHFGLDTDNVFSTFGWSAGTGFTAMRVGNFTANGTMVATGTVTAPTFSGALSGNATTATTLQTARTINGTSFNGSANITTANWGTARNLTIGNTAKSVNGSADVAWSLAEIGARALAWTRRTSAYTAVSGDKIIADTTAGVFTITLPASPTSGSTVIFADGNNWSTNNLTIARNGATIEGFAENLIVDIRSIQLELVFDGTTWQVYAATAPSGGSTVETKTDNVDYKVLFTSSTAGQQSNSLINANNLYFNPSTGTLNATNFNSLSDANQKINIKTIDSAVSIVNRLRGVTFDWKQDQSASLGVIAQEVEEVLPCLVSTSSSGEKSVSYGNIVGVLIEAIKEQQKEIQNLKNKIGDL